MGIRIAAAALVALALASAAIGQTPVRRLATIDALRQFPGYYQLQPVLLRGELAESDTRLTLRAADQEMRVFLLPGVTTLTGPVEIRAQMIDVGRLDPGDPRVAPFADDRGADAWPRPGEELVLMVGSVMPAQPATTPTIRALALEPWRFEGQTVTVVGQFRGRNLLGDQPAAPARSRYDFVLRSGDGAVLVTDLRPRGRGWELNVDARVDTGRWVEVTGTVTRERTLVAIECTAIAEASPPDVVEVDIEPAVPELPRLPVEVVFSSPTPDEIGVPSRTRIRIQFSRGLDPATIDGQFRVSYVGGGQDAAVPAFESTYDAANRAVEIRFAEPLEAFRTVRVEALDGIRGFDDAPFTPWSITFSVGN